MRRLIFGFLLRDKIRALIARVIIRVVGATHIVMRIPSAVQEVYFCFGATGALAPGKKAFALIHIFAPSARISVANGPIWSGRSSWAQPTPYF